MNWFKKATTGMKLDWNTAYKELLEELGRNPTPEEVQKKIFDSEWGDSLEGGFQNKPLFDI